MHSTRSLGGYLLPFALFCVAAYFAMAGVQGAYGLVSRTEIDARANALAVELAALEAETARLTILTRRLSDDYLDLDLLDERARSVLGYLAPTDIVLP